MNPEDERLSVITNAIAYSMETFQFSDERVIDRGPIEVPTAMTDVYARVAQYVLETLDVYERQHRL